MKIIPIFNCAFCCVLYDIFLHNAHMDFVYNLFKICYTI